jgi:hypothetical protein
MSAAAAVIVVIAALLGTSALIAALIVLQGFCASNWRRWVDAPGASAGAALAWVAAVAADLGVGWHVGHHHDPLAPVVLVLGLSFLALIAAQLGRRHPRGDVVAGMAATAALLVVLVVGAVWLAAFRVLGGAAPVVVGATPVAVASLARLAPRPWSLVGAVALGTVTGAVLTATVHLHAHPTGLGPGAVVGAIGGGVVMVMTLIGTRQLAGVTGTRRNALIRGTAPFAVLAAAVLVYPVLRVAGS